MKKNNRALLGAIFAAAVLFTACKKLPPTENLSSDFVVITKYDTSADFSSFKTFSLRDTIAIKTDNLKDSIWYDNGAKSILSNVADHMLAAGYTRVPSGSNNADMIVNVSGIRNVIAFITPGYWWGSPGYPVPCFGNGCYSYYYPYWYSYSVKTGTIMVEIADLKNAPTNKKLHIVWSGIGTGAIGNSKSFIVDQCNKTVDQAFDQSPFFRVY